MCPNGVYRVFIVLCRSLFLLMDFNGSLLVLVGPYAFLWILMGP